ncbi:MAG: MinD/ParA family protein [Desulfobacterium sp.]|nr:MinD/ParA family protein [Desulfobacterium sp.]
MTTIIAVTSGKGGVGKTNISLNLALALGRAGIRTCLFDADIGLANINILINYYPEQTLEDVMEKRLGLDSILFKDYQGIDIVPGSSGIQQMANLDEKEIPSLIRSFSLLGDYDCLIVDSSAGVAKNVISLCLAAPHVMLVLTPEPTSLTDGYALLKVLLMNGFGGKVHVVVNRVSPRAMGQTVFNHFKKVVDKYLKLDILFLGSVDDDPRVARAVKEQRPFLLSYPSTPASDCIRTLADTCRGLMGEPAPEAVNRFWAAYFQALKRNLKTVRKRKRAAGLNAQEKRKVVQSPPSAPPESTPKSAVVPESLVDHPSRKQDMTGLLTELVTGIISISRELRGLREVTNSMVRKGEAAPSAPPPLEQDKAPVITLDFEAYLASVQDRKGS